MIKEKRRDSTFKKEGKIDSFKEKRHDKRTLKQKIKDKLRVFSSSF